MNLKRDRDKRILVICPFPVGVAAGQRLKYEQYFEDWKSLGFSIEVSPFMDMAMWQVLYLPGHYLLKILGVVRGHLRRCRDILRIADYDLVYVHMWVTPVGTTFFERLIRKLSKRLIYDIEDNVLIGNTSLDKKFHPNSFLSMLKGPSKAKFLVEQADHVITSSPFLNSFCLSLNRGLGCTYISSSVDTDRFIPSNPYSNDKQVVIGWTGTFSSRVYLDILRDVFLRLSKRVDFRLRVIGNFDYDLPGVQLEVVRWTKEREVADMQAIDIGVYPLPIDDWVFGKSGLKAIQYMAFGLPVVATNVGTTPLLICQWTDGVLVESLEDWVAALERLVCDPVLRRRLGEAAREKAVKKYSVRAIKRDYVRVFESVMEDTRV